MLEVTDLLVFFIFIVITLFLFHDIQKRGWFSFSPVMVTCLFLYLSNISLALFSFFPALLESAVYASIDSSFHSGEVLIKTYLIQLVLVFTILSFVFIGSNVKKSYLANTLSGFFSMRMPSVSENRVFRVGLFLFILGYSVFLISIFKMGGFQYIFDNQEKRTQITAGYGYYALVYSIFCQMGFFMMYKKLFGKNKLLYLLLIILYLSTFAVFTRRSAIISHFFIIIVFHNFFIQRIDRFLTFKNVTLLLFCVFVAISTHKFRSPDFRSEFVSNPSVIFENMTESFMGSLVFRMGRLERDLVYVGYFSENDYWYGSSYASLLYAPIPSSMYDKKPPVDTGVYIRDIAAGKKINPPVPLTETNVTSWPEGHWAGYSNFGPVGLLSFAAFGSYLWGVLGRMMVLNKYSLFSVILYSKYSFGGVFDMSPMSIVRLLGSFVLMAVVFFIVRKLIVERASFE